MSSYSFGLYTIYIYLNRALIGNWSYTLVYIRLAFMRVLCLEGWQILRSNNNCQVKRICQQSYLIKLNNYYIDFQEFHRSRH